MWPMAFYFTLVAEERRSVVDGRFNELGRSHVLLNRFQLLKSLHIGLQVLGFIEAVLVQFQMFVQQFVDDEIHIWYLYGKTTVSLTNRNCYAFQTPCYTFRKFLLNNQLGQCDTLTSSANLWHYSAFLRCFINRFTIVFQEQRYKADSSNIFFHLSYWMSDLVIL